MATIGEILNRAAIHALLDDQQEISSRLVDLCQMNIGERCPYCESTYVEEIGDGIQCGSCDEIYYPEQLAEKILEHLEDAGVRVNFVGEGVEQ